MPNDERYAAGDVWPLAGELLAYLRPACRRIAVAGSLRRKAETVKDIEIVAEPLLDVQRNLFQQPVSHVSRLDLVLSRLLVEEKLWRGEKNGERQKWFYVPEIGIRLDLYIVLPPAQFGWQLLLRTGPREFSKRAVTGRRYGGLMPSHLHSKGGAIRKINREVVPTPAESDVFELFEIDWIPPEERC